LLLAAVTPFSTAAPHHKKSVEAPPCRFAPTYSQKDVLNNPDAFANDFLYWEGKFHQNGVGYNTANGMTYDGTLLDPTTGIARVGGGHPFSAASKEVCLNLSPDTPQLTPTSPSKSWSMSTP
jgi:hypothetical protein